MLSLLIGLARSNPRAVFYMFVSTLVLTLVGIQHMRLLSARKDTTLCHAQADAMSVSNTALQAMLKEQNTAISLLESATKQKQTKLQEAVSRSHAQMREAQAKATRYQTDALPKDECAALKTLLRNFHAGQAGQ